MLCLVLINHHASLFHFLQPHHIEPPRRTDPSPQPKTKHAPAEATAVPPSSCACRALVMALKSATTACPMCFKGKTLVSATKSISQSIHPSTHPSTTHNPRTAPRRDPAELPLAVHIRVVGDMQLVVQGRPAPLRRLPLRPLLHLLPLHLPHHGRLALGQHGRLRVLDLGWSGLSGGGGEKGGLNLTRWIKDTTPHHHHHHYQNSA